MTLSPAVQRKVSHAGTTHPSFEKASQELAAMADLKIRAKQVERWTKRVGQERVEERDAEVRQWQAMPLPKRRQCAVSVPQDTVAAISLDGGRAQTWSEADAAPTTSDEEALVAPVEPPPESRSSHWRETRIGCAMTFTSTPQATDPRPQIPLKFVDPAKIRKLTREIGHAVPGDGVGMQAESEKAAASPPDDQPGSDESASAEDLPAAAGEYAAGASSSSKLDNPAHPKLKSKSVTATRRCFDALAKMLLARAWRQGFPTADRKAFLGDGAAVLWRIWQEYFSTYTPILDFIHVISYVYAAALAGRPYAEGWEIYRRWAQWTWEGNVDLVIAELTARSAELGPPQKGDSDTCPRRVAARALTYLTNHRQYMHYAKYRRQGLPITTSHMESTVKQVSRRVKGTEKFWSESGIEALLQLTADELSDDMPLDEFWQNRPKRHQGQRRNSRTRAPSYATAS